MRRGAALDVEELRTRGFTVVRQFCDRASCQAARDAIDGFFGPAAEVCAGVADEALGHNGGNSNFTHVASHPNPVLMVMAHVLPELAAAHAASLHSDAEHMRLNGQHFIRTDPSPDALPGAANWHIDNTFLPQHEQSHPRQVYTRSILALNTQSSGGAPLWMSSGAVNAARDVVSKQVAEQGEEQYNGREWISRVHRELIVQATDHGPSLGAAAAARPDWAASRGRGLADTVEPPQEVLLNEGDLVMFDAMSLHSASACTNGQSRYVLTSSFHDERALQMPHKLYMTAFAPEFVAAVPQAVRGACSKTGARP